MKIFDTSVQAVNNLPTVNHPSRDEYGILGALVQAVNDLPTVNHPSRD